MILRRPCMSATVAFVLMAGCGTDQDPVAPDASEPLTAIVEHRAVIAGETLPSVRITSAGDDVIVEVSRPALCATLVEAFAAREGRALSVVARLSSNALASCASNVPVAWVVDYLVTIPRVEKGTWDVRVFETQDNARAVFLREQRVRVQ